MPKTAILPVDLNKRGVQVGSDILTKDITGTPITSPVSIAAGAIKTLEIPTNAVEISIYSADDVYVSEDVAFASYTLLPLLIKETFGVFKATQIHLKNPGAGSIDVYFSFTVL